MKKKDAEGLLIYYNNHGLSGYYNYPSAHNCNRLVD